VRAKTENTKHQAKNSCRVVQELFQMKKELGKKVAAGAAWMVGMKLLVQSLGLISTLILARLLVPEDFGLIAIAMIFFAVLEVMTSFSFDLALIQNQEAKRHHYDTAWTLTIIQGGVTAIALCLLASPAADFFNDPRLINIIYVMAFIAFVQSFENIGIVAFRKELEMRKEFIFLVAKKLAAFTVTIGLAIILKNYWALVLGTLASRVTGLLLSYWMHPYRPRPSLKAARELITYTKWLLLNNVLLVLIKNSDDAIVGKVLGPAGLGFYTIAYEISNLPTTELVYPITRAVFPGYAKIAADMKQLRKGFLDVTSLVLLLTIPIAAGIAVTADLFIPIVLGQKWQQAAELTQILALFGITRVLGAGTGSVYLAIGKPKVIAYLACFRLVIGIPLIYFATVSAGAAGAAWAVFAIGLILVPINYSILLKLLALPLNDLFSAIWRPVLAGIIMSGIIIWYRTFWLTGDIWWQVGELASSVLIGAIVYIAAVLALWRYSGYPASSERLVLETLKSRIKKQTK